LWRRIQLDPHNADGDDAPGYDYSAHDDHAANHDDTGAIISHDHDRS